MYRGQLREQLQPLSAHSLAVQTLILVLDISLSYKEKTILLIIKTKKNNQQKNKMKILKNKL